MNCKECREHFTEYGQQKLPGEQAGQLQQHLAHCSACEDAWQEFRQLFVLLDATDPLLIQSQQRIHSQLLTAASTSASDIGRPSLAETLFQRFWPSKPMWASAYSLMLLLAGGLSSQLLPVNGSEGGSASTALICPVMSPSSQWLPDQGAHSLPPYSLT